MDDPRFGQHQAPPVIRVTESELPTGLK